MYQVLCRLMGSNRNSSFYTSDANAERFIFGRIIALDEEWIVLQEISPDGEDDGFVLMQTDRVFRIEENGQYADKMKELITEQRIQNYQLPTRYDSIVQNVLAYSQNHKTIVSIELRNSGYNNVVGFVDTLENNICAIHLVDEYGLSDGTCYIRQNEITQISVLSTSEKRIEKLWRITNSL